MIELNLIEAKFWIVPINMNVEMDLYVQDTHFVLISSAKTDVGPAPFVWRTASLDCVPPPQVPGRGGELAA